VQQVAPQAAYRRAQVSSKGPLKPSKPGVVWIESIVRLSDIDPSQIDPNNQATLDKYGLERIPVNI
jgi:hypothetical protein